MREKINWKIVLIVIAILAVIVIGIVILKVFGMKNQSQDRSYVLEQVSDEDYEYFPFFSNDKYGVIDKKGEIVIENKYKNVTIPNPTKAVFIAETFDSNYEVLNEKGERIFTEYSNIEPIRIDYAITNLPYEKSLLKFSENGKFGLINFSGKIISKAIYEEISSVKFKEGEIIAKKDGKYGVINNKGVELIPFEYEEIEADKYYKNGGYEESGYIVKVKTEEGYRYGYITNKWEKLLDTEYSSMSRISSINSKEIYLIASKDGRYGVMKNAEVKIDFNYQGIEYNSDNNLFVVQRGGQYGVISFEGDTIIDIEYKSIKFNGAYIVAKTYAEDRYFTSKGEQTQDNNVSMTNVPSEDVYIISNKESLYGIIDKKGEKLVENEYLYIEYALDKCFIAYKMGEGLGAIDKNGNVQISFGYDVLSKIGDYPVLKGVNMGNNITDIYSKDMEKILSIQNAVIDIKDEYIEVYNENSDNFITKSGELKSSKEILVNNKLFPVFKDNLWGFEDREGNIAVAPKYDYVTEFNSYGFAGIKQEGKWGVINEDGNIVCECIFAFEELEENFKPEFIGKYYKTYNENNEICYTDRM